VWKDKKAVHFINTTYNPKEKTQVERKQKDSSGMMVDCLASVQKYNKFMGGVDIADAK
jgi:hypothetical protein